MDYRQSKDAFVHCRSDDQVAQPFLEWGVGQMTIATCSLHICAHSLPRDLCIIATQTSKDIGIVMQIYGASISEWIDTQEFPR